MPDKKLTDNEIIKGLRSWLEEIRKARQAYHEITRLQAENEKLQKFKAYFDFYYGCDVEILGIDENGDTTFFDEFYNCAIANAESIEHHIAHIIKRAKAEAYKECIEKVKALFPSYDEPYQYWEIHEGADNLLKELVGGENGEEG